MRSLRALRALARVELRQLRRHAGRSLLVALLVAVPVAALVGGGTLFRVTRQTLEEERAEALGRAALRVDAGAGLALEAARDAFPAQARVELVLVGRADVRVPGRRLRAKSFALEPAALSPSGLAAGLLILAEGRAPTGADEVALSPVLLAGLGRSLGETVTLASGPMRITGAVLDPEHLDLPVVWQVVDPARPPEPRVARSLLVDLPDADAADVAQRLRAAGFRVTARSEVGGSDGFEDVALFVVGGFGFFEAALVIAAAFAVSLRRRQREIGLLGSTGAPRGGIRASMVFSAATLAALGGLVGALVGLASAAALQPFLDGWNRRANGDFEVSPEHLVGALVLGIVTAMAAAVVPARSATRLPIRMALSGRRPPSESSRVWLVLGLALLVGGFGAMLWGARNEGFVAGTGILAGSILGVLGFGACSPWLLDALAHLAAPLPLAWRLAVRDAGRFRTRNGPVVTAVLAGMSISVLVGALAASISSAVDAFPPALRDDQLLVEGPGAEDVCARLGEELACLAAVPLTAAHFRGEPVRARFAQRPKFGPAQTARSGEGWVACGREELLRAMDLEAGAGGFRSGRLLALAELGPPAEPGNAEHVELAASGLEGDRARPVVERLAPAQRVAAPAFVLSVERAAELGLEPGPPPGRTLVPWLVRLDAPITPALLERAQGVAAGSAGTFVTAEVARGDPTLVFVRIVLSICIATGLVVVFIATALSAVESAADAQVLYTVGGAPGLLRVHPAARAAYLALLGGALAVPGGLIPFFGLQALANFPLEFSMPWSAVLAAVLVLPATAFAGTWLVALARQALGAPSAPRVAAD